MFKLNKQQKSKLKEVAEEHDLKFVILHGSYATGDEREDSDLDIAVFGNEFISFEDVVNMHPDFADIFENNEQRELDLKSLHGKDPLFRYLVVRDSRLLYGDETEFNEFKSYAFRSYLDAQPLFDLERKKVREYFKAKA